MGRKAYITIHSIIKVTMRSTRVPYTLSLFTLLPAFGLNYLIIGATKMVILYSLDHPDNSIVVIYYKLHQVTLVLVTKLVVSLMK